MPYYHGTRPDIAEDILAHGFDVNAPRQNDPGDLGWGTYLTDRLRRARAYGSGVLTVEIDESRFARLPNPYFLDGLAEVEPETLVERVFHRLAFANGEMLTVRGSKEVRVTMAKRIAESFLTVGYAGIIAGPYRDGATEVVVFDPSAIVSVRPVYRIRHGDD